MSKNSFKGSSEDILSYVANNLNKGMGDIPTPEEFKLAPKTHIKFIEDFPIHLYPPRGCQTFDIRRAITLTNPTQTGLLVDFIVPEAVVGFWRSYSFFTNTQAGTITKLDMRLNNNVVFKYHGDSLANFDKNLALGTDIASEIDALQELQAGDRITITAALSVAPPVGIPATVAARIKGWLITDRIELRGRSS